MMMTDVKEYVHYNDRTNSYTNKIYGIIIIKSFFFKWINKYWSETPHACLLACLSLHTAHLQYQCVYLNQPSQLVDRTLSEGLYPTLEKLDPNSIHRYSNNIEKNTTSHEKEEEV